MRVGIIGCGHISQWHIESLRRLPGLEIVGVADPDEARARETAHRFGIQNVYRDAEKMLRERRPDVVHILTPPQAHKALSLLAMEAGCHVLVEKPMALNVKEADEMIAASRHHGVGLGVCHNFLFDPAVIKAKELIARGEMGRVIAVEICWRLYRAREPDRYQTNQWIYELPGGVFHEVAPHPVCLQMEFLKTLRVVSALSKKIGSDLPTPWDELRILLDGVSGMGFFSISACASPYRKFMIIYGTEMTIQVDLTNNTLVKFRRSPLKMASKALANIDHSLQLFSNTITDTIKNLRGQMVWTLGHRTLIEKFYESLRQGTDPPVTGEDGRAVVAVLDAIWAKLDTPHARREAG